MGFIPQWWQKYCKHFKRRFFVNDDEASSFDNSVELTWKIIIEQKFLKLKKIFQNFCCTRKKIIRSSFCTIPTWNNLDHYSVHNSLILAVQYGNFLFNRSLSCHVGVLQIQIYYLFSSQFQSRNFCAIIQIL